jgi:hypothetical protein
VGPCAHVDRDREEDGVTAEDEAPDCEACHGAGYFNGCGDEMCDCSDSDCEECDGTGKAKETT